ncbi:peptide-N4-(N-acetyl-beta-glucosaminyl)asparagine amidase A-like [Euphorbia lathyris]|uniref:peptide-N4-(N-acetyl-beta- glucosaminyl)asparagine amidase A-like n=1 Tax=Euphorbia lathyris TaxID=212925 RepID=UPI003314133C
MASSLVPLFLSFFIFFIFHPFPSVADIHTAKTLLRSNHFSQLPSIQKNDTTPPTVYFEVTKPINVPNSKPCAHTLLQHDFGYTYGKPPVLVNYTSPSHCPFHHFSKIIFEWNATSKGRQFDRIFGVWLGGVELLRSCTAEPRATGTFWSVQKDITRYSSLLVKDEIQQLAVYLGNIIDSTYTGVYHVNITIYFYPAKEKSDYSVDGLNNLRAPDVSKADLILPISRNLPLNDGLWFEIENNTQTQLKEFQIPQNVYRVVLEVYVSFHENDEFWFANYPNDYIIANNLTDATGNGPFREVLISLDEDVVGAIWPFTVIFTGGANPLLWRPITGIGSFNLPSYDIEITPFLGNILDGKIHKLGFTVTNALNVWYIDANLHLWLDHKSEKTQGKVLSHKSKPLLFSSMSNFIDLNGTFKTYAARNITSTGWVRSSLGKITTHFKQQFSYKNSMEVGENMNLQIVNQRIRVSDGVSFKKVKSEVHSFESLKQFDLEYYSDSFDQGNGSSLYITNVKLGLNEKKSSEKSRESSVKNVQKGEGVMVVKNNLVISGEGRTQQVYKYDGGEFCYFRNVSSSNYSIIYDNVKNKCNRKKEIPYLASELLNVNLNGV